MRGRYALALLGACGFTPGKLPDGWLEEAGVARDAPGGGSAGDAMIDGPVDAPVDPCASLALPASCGSGALFTCAGSTTCYARCPQATDWPASESRCFVWGGHLATVTSDAEATCIATAVGGVRAWIGYVQALGSTFEPNLAWGWVSGTFSTYTRWNTAAGQPNNATDQSPEGQDCAFADLATGVWYDHECSAVEHGFVCER